MRLAGERLLASYRSNRDWNEVSPFNECSPADLKALIEDLRQFRNAYVEHLNATLPVVQSGRPIDHTATRTRVLHLA
jgi:hypothetical protein